MKNIALQTLDPLGPELLPYHPDEPSAKDLRPTGTLSYLLPLLFTVTRSLAGRPNCVCGRMLRSQDCGFNRQAHDELGTLSWLATHLN